VSRNWKIDSGELIAVLEEFGFDVEQSDVSLPGGGGNLTARKETATRAVLVKTDAGGRLQILLTVELADESAEPLEIAGMQLSVSDSTIRRRTLRGTLNNAGQFRAVIEFFAQEEDFNEPPPV
jgi:hypothetical protein